MLQNHAVVHIHLGSIMAIVANPRWGLRMIIDLNVANTIED